MHKFGFGKEDTRKQVEHASSIGRLVDPREFPIVILIRVDRKQSPADIVTSPSASHYSRHVDCNESCFPFKRFHVIVSKKNNHLALFAKYWEPGKVKTRLAANIGDHAASKIYQAFLQNLLRRLNHVGNERSIVYSPSERISEFRSLAGHDWTLSPQSSGGLGDRLTSFVSSKFTPTEMNLNLVIIGSDCLDIDQELVDQAFDALDRAQVVLGPTHDGGYYLIGLSEHLPVIFQDIDWSTESVFQQTLAHIRTQNLTSVELPTLNDIDEFEDLSKLRERLEGQGSDNVLDQELLLSINEALAT